MSDTASIAIARKRLRVPLWDNARFIAVALVVVGHGIQRLIGEDDRALVAYLFIYAFHMPAFALISGYFSKPGAPNARQTRKVITDILIPYLIMETIWTIVKNLVEGRSGFNPSEPSWTLWFLLALAFFRLILPYLSQLRWPLLWAVALSVGVGFMGNVDSTFSLSRAIGILPFFVLGWKLHEWGLVDRWRELGKRIWFVRAGAVAVFGAWLAVLWVFVDYWREIDLRFWFFYDDSYNDLGAHNWTAGLVRLAFIALAIVLSAAFFALIPRSRSWLTPLGQGTMYIYLLHSFVLYPVRETDFLQEHASALWLVIVTFVCILISIILASRPVRWLFRPIIEPKVRWLFTRKDGADAAPPERGPSRTDPTGSRRDAPTGPDRSER